VRSHKGLHVQGGADRTGGLILNNVVFHAIHITLTLKLGDHEGLSVHGWLLKRTLLVCGPDPDSDPCIPESCSCLLLSPVWDFLVLPGSYWWDASAPAPDSGKVSIGCVYFALFLLILLVLLMFLVKFLYSVLSLCPFSSFSLPLVGGWGLIASICHAV